MRLPIYQIDAFTDETFKGNPAAVIPLKQWLAEDAMQKIAQENNLSETAFLVKKGNSYELRWFTPSEEVDLCGHATLASAFVIHNYVSPGQRDMQFETRSGLLRVTVENDVFILTFPAKESITVDCPEELIKGLGKIPKEVRKADDYLVVFESEEDILSLKPNFEVLKKVDSRGVIVTAKGNEADFVSRFFVPRIGIPEDPVTGSSHCMLVPYWKGQLHKNEFKAIQLSKRGGKLYCADAGDRVKIAGKAVIYLEGNIFL